MTIDISEQKDDYNRIVVSSRKESTITTFSITWANFMSQQALPPLKPYSTLPEQASQTPWAGE